MTREQWRIHLDVSGWLTICNMILINSQQNFVYLKNNIQFYTTETMRHVYEAMDAMKKKYIFLCVCVCVCVCARKRVALPSMQSACVLYCHLRPLCLHIIFRHYLIKGTIFEKKKTCY
jgi:hypothetical protein